MNLATGILIALVGVLIAGLASVIGIWMERDASRPKHWAFSLSALILLTTVVSMVQSYGDALASEKMEEDLARMLAQLDRIASESDVEIPGLNNLLSKEMEAQSRSNPDVMSKLSDRVAADGGDPKAMMGRHLPPSEMNNLNSGIGGKGDGKPMGSSPADKAKIEKLEKKIAAMESESKKGSEAEDKLKSEIAALKAESQKLSEQQDEQQAAQAAAIEALKTENEDLKEKLKKNAKKNNGAALWSTKG